MGKSTSVWPGGNVAMVLKLGNADRILIDGNTAWDAVAAQALAAWNSHLGTIQFLPTTQSPGVGRDGDGINQVCFNSTVYGQSFGHLVLAVTTSWFSATTRTEADVTFNTAISWDSYPGPLRYPDGKLLCDFRRVALHEFGHVLGLDHPDQAGQTVSALMNSVTRDLDGLTTDDILGAQALYRLEPPTIAAQPQTQTVTAGSTVTFAVAATGSQPMTYQWYRNGSAIAGATAARLAISGAESSDAGHYQVRVSNAAGIVTSGAATLTVEEAPLAAVHQLSQPEVRARIELSPEITVCWESLSNLVYRVQYRSNWTTDTWADLASPVQGNGGTACVVDSTGAQPHRFYRVVTLSEQ